MNEKKQVLKVIAEVFEKAKGSSLSTSFMKDQESNLTFLIDYLGVTSMQALFVATLFGLSQERRSAGYHDFSRYFDINPIKVFEFYDDLEFLYRQGLIRKIRPRYGRGVNEFSYDFVINPQVIEAILKGIPISKSKGTLHKDFFEFLSEFEVLIEQRESDQISTGDLFAFTEELAEKGAHLSEMELIKSFRFTDMNLTIFLYMLLLRVRGNSSPFLSSLLEDIIEYNGMRYQAMQRLFNNESQLTHEGYLEIDNSGFVQHAEIRLTEKSLSALREVGFNLHSSQSKRKNIISPEDIFQKTLFYSVSEQNQIDMLSRLLIDEEFQKTQQRLKERGFPIGVNVLLHGAPGTGKTETALQLAKVTGRELMKVDISDSKSMWFGESEKKMKRIFTDYRAFMKECKQAPILLFNEADAIISKRKDVSRSNVAQVENSLQNILLDEMENFEGILIATTNFVTNMDAAFERRFLFKVEFETLGIDVRSKIWKQKLSTLSSEECDILAERFQFSGGQIDNIVRKKEIHEIMNGGVASLDLLIEFCRQESWIASPTRIGFNF